MRRTDALLVPCFRLCVKRLLKMLVINWIRHRTKNGVEFNSGTDSTLYILQKAQCDPGEVAMT